MSFENSLSIHYLPAERTAVFTNLSALEATLKPRIKYLTSEERQKYESINKSNKLIVNKVMNYRMRHPNLSSPNVDWMEFQNDFDSRDFLQGTILRLQNLIDGLSNNLILHEFDNYQAALTDYDFSRYKAMTKIPGFENKVSEVAQFFNKTGTTATTLKGEAETIVS